jgi:predicted NBD/HSP70 family sugar kinase
MNYYLTLDIGGTDLKYGVINKDNELLFKSITKTNGHLGAKELMNTIKRLFNEQSKNYKLEGIAISTTGGIDDDTNVLIPNLSITDYHTINFREELKELGVNIAVENDVNSMGLCEKDLVPNSDKMKCVLAMTVGTGIGGAIFIDNKMHKGFKYTAGEWGKIFMNCKNDSYEKLSSTNALIREAKKVRPEVNTGIDVFNLYDNGDIEIAAVVKKFYQGLAKGIANLVYILNPEHIVIGGGITNRGPRFIEELRAELKPLLWDYLYDSLELSLAKNKNDAGMIGAFINFKNIFL